MVRSTRRAVPAIGDKHLFRNIHAVTIYLQFVLRRPVFHLQPARRFPCFLCFTGFRPKGFGTWLLILFGIVNAVGCNPTSQSNRERASGNSSTHVLSLASVRRLMDDGRAEEAKDELQRMLLVDPENSECVFLLAQCVHSTGNPQQAIELLERISSPKDRWTMPALGQSADWLRS